MDVYNSDDEQVEALKKWWSENGMSIVGGIVLGLAGVLGWQGWQGYQSQVSEAGAAQFNAMSQSVENGKTEQATAQAQQMMNDYKGSAYGVFGAWTLASIEVTHGDLESAATHLQWAMDNTPDESMGQISKLRLSRVLISLNKLDEAAKLTQGKQSPAFAGEFDVLAGDIAMLKGDTTMAQEAYRRALRNDVSAKNEVEMKLNDLGPKSMGQES